MSDKKNSIVIFDDDKTSLSLLTEILGESYTVYSELDGTKCHEIAIKLKPDLILLDIIMPDMSGFDVIKTLKESEETKDIPVIFVTNLTGPDEEDRGLSLGAVDYIKKPFDAKVVKERVSAQMKIIKQR
ncbi:MAG: response regulator [Oscillospiraceae bacterium]|nr:response regulator [Oscillospiraceae bacterium]MCL2278157.1 response regulator [Oscillospiraceae bacterium]